MRLEHMEPTLIYADTIDAIEKMYDAKFVFDSCIQSKSGQWYNFPAAIFYTEKAHPKGSNYFALFRNCDEWTITDGITATEPFNGVIVGGKLYYSRYRHDFVTIPGGFVDGGRDYIRWSGDGEMVRVQVVEDHLELVAT